MDVAWPCLELDLSGDTYGITGDLETVLGGALLGGGDLENLLVGVLEYLLGGVLEYLLDGVFDLLGGVLENLNGEFPENLLEGLLELVRLGDLTL